MSNDEPNATAHSLSRDAGLSFEDAVLAVGVHEPVDGLRHARPAAYLGSNRRRLYGIQYAHDFWR